MIKFSYIIDDDENRIQDIKTKIEQLEIQTFSPEVVGRNESNRNTGIQTGDGAATNPYPLWYPIRDFGSVGSLTLDIVLNRTDSHVAKLTATGDIDFAFSIPPGTNKMMWFILDVTVDATGGYTFNLLNTILPAGISIDNTANARTVIRFTTTDAGVTYYAENLTTGGGGLSEPVILTINTITPQTLPTTSVIDWSKNPNQITLDRDVEFSFSNLPASGSYEGLVVIIDVDATGGYAAPIWPAALSNPPLISTTPLTRTSVVLYTIDGGTTVTHASSVGSIIAGGANTSLSNLTTTSINQNLLPDGNSTRNLGASGLQWNTLWIDTLENATTVVIASPNFSINSSQITLGDAVTDTITFLGRIGSNAIIPIADATTDLGTSALAYQTLYVDSISNASTIAITSPNFAINSAQITLGDAITDDISFLGQVDTNIVIEEISIPAAAPANTGRFYAKDDGGVSNPFWIDEAGTETSMLGGASLLSSNNTWTGINTFTGTTFNVNTTAINLGDATSDSINFLGRIGTDIDPNADGTLSLGSSALEWGTIFVQTINATATTAVASPTFSINSSTINLGDATTDAINFLGRINSNILPIADATHDLGSSALAFDTLFIDIISNAAATNVISPTFNINSATINIGDAVGDSVNILGTIQSNLIINADVEFSDNDLTGANNIFITTAASAAVASIRGIDAATDVLELRLGAAVDFAVTDNGTTRVAFNNTLLRWEFGGSNIVQLPQETQISDRASAPSTPASGFASLYVINVAGAQSLRVKFDNGTEKTIADDT